MDAQCDKLATVIGRTKLTTLVTIDVPWRKKNRKIGEIQSWDKFEKIFEDIRFPF